MPREADLARRAAVREREQRGRVGRVAPGREDRDAEAGGDEAAQGLGVLALERDARAEAGPRAEVLGQAAQAVAGAHHHEVVAGHVGEAHAAPAGEAVARRDREAQRFAHEHAPADPGVLGPRARDEQVVPALEQAVAERAGAVLAEQEADVRVRGAVRADQLGDEPRAEGVQEPEADLARGGVRGAAHRRVAGVELLERPARVGGEHAAVLVGLQRPADAVEQADADVVLEAPQRARQRGLRDVQRRGGAGDVRLVDHGDEPAELIDLHRTSAIDAVRASKHCQ